VKQLKEKKRGQATFLAGCGERKPGYSIFRVWSKNDLPLEDGLDGLPLRVSEDPDARRAGRGGWSVRGRGETGAGRSGLLRLSGWFRLFGLSGCSGH